MTKLEELPISSFYGSWMRIDSCDETELKSQFPILPILDYVYHLHQCEPNEFAYFKFVQDRNRPSYGKLAYLSMISICRFWKKEYDDRFSTWYLYGHFCLFRRWHIYQKIFRSKRAVDRAANRRYENSTIFQWCAIRMGNYEHESNPFPFLQSSGLIDSH